MNDCEVVVPQRNASGQRSSLARIALVAALCGFVLFVTGCSTDQEVAKPALPAGASAELSLAALHQSDARVESTNHQSARELIIVVAPGVDLMPVEALRGTLKGLADDSIIVEPLFGDSIQALRASTIEGVDGAKVPDLSKFLIVRAADDRLDALAERIRKLPGVVAAYVKPPARVPQIDVRSLKLNQMTPRPPSPSVAPPNYVNREGYLNQAPEGIDAHYAWTLKGGKGDGVTLIDLEWGWTFDHDDLRERSKGLLLGPNEKPFDHGTAVLGIVGGDANKWGVTGIAPEAEIGAVSLGDARARAIKFAADKLRVGDVMLLEVHLPGPAANGIGDFGYIAVEWWLDELEAIQYATARGVIVVEPAGNGFQNLDDGLYDTPMLGFPPAWRNPFGKGGPDSGAIVVGAGNPPPGTHGLTEEPDWKEEYVDRARCVFSNYGQRVDVQGWGWQATSTGYGDLAGGPNERSWYTDQFAGTSSASPIVAGAIVCLQGVRRAQNKAPLSPRIIRELLRTTGSAQQDAPQRPASQRIGSRPDLRALIKASANY